MRPVSFLLASIITAYPGNAFAEHVSLLLQDEELDETAIQDGNFHWGILKEHLRNLTASKEAVENLASDYIDVFERGKSENSLYETEYGRDRAFVKGKELADIAGFYQAFGMSFGEEGSQRESLDHVAVELEFYALMLFKQQKLMELQDREGQEIVEDGRRKFLQDHLGRFATGIAQRPRINAHPVYGPLFAWVGSLVSRECESLGVQPFKLDWINPAEESENMACGAVQSAQNTVC